MYPATFFGLFPPFPLTNRAFVAMSFDARFDRRWTDVLIPALKSIPMGDQPLEPHRVDLSKRGDSARLSLLALKVNTDCTIYTAQAHQEEPMKNGTVLNGFLAIVTVLVTGSACSSSYGTKLDFNGHELFYTDKVTEVDAKKLGDYLVKGGFFKGDALRVQLDKAGATYQFRMPMRPGTQDDLELRRDLRRLTNLISADVFNGAATEIYTCDDQLKACKVINLD